MQIVSYLRVSTARQGASGLGLEAQRAAVQSFADTGGHTIVAEFVEVESGRKADRPQLTSALGTCRLHRATLVIAKLDRLARNVAFIAGLMNGNVEFVACDMPHANRLTLHLMAAMAEHEREMISQRTKAALQAARARGVRLGNPNGATALLRGCSEAARTSSVARQAKASQHAAAVAQTLADLTSAGMSNGEMAAHLNRQGVPSPSGGGWYPEQVRRTVQRLKASPGAGAHA
jgi:DNA invertase Pin-like site-specific DNA recombinase